MSFFDSLLEGPRDACRQVGFLAFGVAYYTLAFWVGVFRYLGFNIFPDWVNL